MILPVYVHVPFCRSKCPYCAFLSTATDGEPGLAYMAALLSEIAGRFGGPGAAVSVPSIYFGGGTPSLLSPGQTGHILRTIRQNAAVEPNAEITLEANPGTIDRERSAAYREASVNRISIGCQSFHDGLLRTLGRIHSGAQALAAYRDVRAGGVDNISVDLMFGIPGQTVALWRETLAHAIDLGPDHISLYCLTIEPGTAFAERRDHGELFPFEGDREREEREADMFELAMDMLPEAGYDHYEIANFAQPGRECAHNLGYWRNEPYIGFGPAAHSYLPTESPPLCERSGNVSDVDEYVMLIRTRGIAVASRERLGVRKAVGESIMLGLRMMRGIDLGEVGRRWGLDPAEHFAGEIARLADKGLIDREGPVIRLTRRGILLADEVMQLFL